MVNKYSTYSEKELIENLHSKWKKNRDGAFTEIYNRYSDIIYRYLFSMVKNQETVYDIFQDVFCNFLEYSKEKPVNNIAGFLKSTARNLFINLQRQNKFKSDIELTDDILIDSSEVINLDYKKDIMNIFDDAVKQLPETRREIFIMRYYMQCDYDEIEQLTGLARSNLRQMIYRAKLDLKDILKPFYEDILN